ncbi:Pentatricopeptide repeat-containing protein, mitochondrial [Glycine soja]|nr:hypothetical protein JHK85_017687 [Glycine max]
MNPTGKSSTLYPPPSHPSVSNTSSSPSETTSSSSPLVFDALFNTLAHTNKFRHATLAYTLMKEHGFSPTVESCNAFMSSLLHLRRADIALAFYREMRRRSCVSPNVYTLNMAIRAYCMLGEVQKGFEMS